MGTALGWHSAAWSDSDRHVRPQALMSSPNVWLPVQGVAVGGLGVRPSGCWWDRAGVC